MKVYHCSRSFTCSRPFTCSRSGVFIWSKSNCLVTCCWGRRKNTSCQTTGFGLSESCHLQKSPKILSDCCGLDREGLSLKKGFVWGLPQGAPRDWGTSSPDSGKDKVTEKQSCPRGPEAAEGLLQKQQMEKEDKAHKAAAKEHCSATG
ncbi:hypothetical protein ACOMHN_041536 [Nucella lapillus]